MLITEPNLSTKALQPGRPPRASYQAEDGGVLTRSGEVRADGRGAGGGLPSRRSPTHRLSTLAKQHPSQSLGWRGWDASWDCQ